LLGESGRRWHVIREEIAAAERLQRMFDGERRAQRRRWLRVGRRAWPPTAIQVIPQLRHQYRWRAWAVVACAAAAPTDVEAVAGAQQCLQEQVAIVLAAGAVAGPIQAATAAIGVRMTPQAHQVEIHGL